jgi:branched-chain amino acid transport system substrate-binding protein
VVALLLSVALAGCSTGPTDDMTFSVATMFPSAGVDAAVGQAMQRAVDLAVRQNAALGKGYKLTAAHVAEGAGVEQATTALVADHHVMALVGPLDSQTALALLPIIEQNGIATISPSATLAGLTRADRAAALGIPFATLHPAGKPVAFFRLPASDEALAQAAADLARAPGSQHGLAAGSAFVVDDGTASGKAGADAYRQEFAAKHGAISGRATMAAVPSDNTQGIVTAIIKADPDVVFFAGSTAAGARLRATITLTGAPQIQLLATGPLADHPAWGATVGVTAASAYTTAVLAAPDLSTLSNAKSFVAAYQAAYPGKDVVPQAALAYDAAMDEITAIKALVQTGKPVTRTAVLSAVATAKYPGVTGTLAFDKNGDNVSPPGFAVYSCDIKGAWHYETHLGG